MQNFEYKCEEHGVFELMRPSGLRRHPGPCPDCGKLSHRIFNSMPNLRQIDATKKEGIERNIKSQFEPHVCGPSCEHEAPGLIPPKPKQLPKVQSYNGPRSWVIEHSI